MSTSPAVVATAAADSINDVVEDVWRGLTPLERALLMKFVSTSSTRFSCKRVSKFVCVSESSTEVASHGTKSAIAEAIRRCGGERSQLERSPKVVMTGGHLFLMSLVETNLPSLAIKLLTLFAAKKPCAAFVEQSLRLSASSGPCLAEVTRNTGRVGFREEDEEENKEEEEEAESRVDGESQVNVPMRTHADGQGGSSASTGTGISLLHVAARHGCCRKLKHFLTADLVNRTNSSGDTPLHWAAIGGHADDVELLLEAGATVRVNASGWTPLHSASASTKPNAGVAALLISAICGVGSNRSLLNARSTEGGNTALHLAAMSRHVKPDYIRQLSELDPAALNDRDMTPLQTAATNVYFSPDAVVAMLETYLPSIDIASVDAAVVKDNSEDFRIAAENVGAIGLKVLTPKTAGVGELPPSFGTKIVDCRSLINSLLDTCARNGNVEAVRLLVPYSGCQADRCEVLHNVIRESVKRPDRLEKYRAIYAVFVLHALEDVEEGDKGPDRESRYTPEEAKAAKGRVLALTERRLQRDGLNAIERAIDCGAYDLLVEILNTTKVYRYDMQGIRTRDLMDNYCEYIHYDVTNMIDTTMSKKPPPGSASSKRSLREIFKIRKCYLRRVIDADKWCDRDLLEVQPFRKLTKPYTGFVQRMYCLLGAIQLAFMTVLSVLYLPSACNLGDQFCLNITSCDSLNLTVCRQGNTTNYYNGTETSEIVSDLVHALQTGYYHDEQVNHRNNPHIGWIAWPLMQFTANAMTLLYWTLAAVRKAYCQWKSDKIYAKRRRGHSADGRLVRKREGILTDLLVRYVEKLPYIGFSLSMFKWYHDYQTNTVFPAYLEVTSMVFLFGWITCLKYLSGMTKALHVFSLVLKDIIIKDLAMNFMPVYMLTIVGFSFSLHVLRQTTLPLENVDSLNVTVYQSFVSVLTIGNLYDITDANLNPDYSIAGGRLGFLKIVYGSFLCFCNIILLNVLIAMMNDRYQTAKQNAEHAWRHDSVALVIELQKWRLTRWLLHAVHKLHYFCMFCCCCCCDATYTSDGRYYVDIRKRL